MLPLETRASLEILVQRSLGHDGGWDVDHIRWEGRTDLRIHLKLARRRGWSCHACSRARVLHDTVHRSWRHLDILGWRSWVSAPVPRTRCPEHGVRAVTIPWSDARSRMTRGFEGLAAALLERHETASVARILGITWDQARRIKVRRSARG